MNHPCTRRVSHLSLIVVVFATIAYLLAGSNVHADVWIETGDAGETLFTAQKTGTGSQPLTAIIGGLTSDHADLYQIYITDFSQFSATAGAGFDGQLFLFDANGFGVAANDDRSTFNLSPRLPVGAAAYSGHTAGVYYLGISGYDYDPISAGGLIFPTTPFTPVYGPTGPGGNQSLSGWAGSSAGTIGLYAISLTGVRTSAVAVVPEPGEVATGLVFSGAVIASLLYGRWRRRRPYNLRRKRKRNLAAPSVPTPA